jgi:AcrR family transcriptional regulator
MSIRQRAIQAADKRERRDTILDAAERLLRGQPERVASMAEVAVEAGLAKGTLYLYFASKEELLLAVHERLIERFFSDLIALVEDAPTVDFAAVLALTRAHLIDSSLFLPLAARCLGLMTHSVPAAVALAFKERMAARLERAGAGIERRFGAMDTGRGVSLLRHSYALILGLWQMSAAIGAARGGPAQPGPVSAALAWHYPEEIEVGLRALWAGMFGTLAAPGEQR